MAAPRTTVKHICCVCEKHHVQLEKEKQEMFMKEIILLLPLSILKDVFGNLIVLLGCQCKI